MCYEHPHLLAERPIRRLCLLPGERIVNTAQFGYDNQGTDHGCCARQMDCVSEVQQDVDVVGTLRGSGRSGPRP